MASRSPIVSETLYPIRARTSKTPVDVIPSGDARGASQRGITTLHATSVHPSAAAPGAMRFGEAGSLFFYTPNATGVPFGVFPHTHSHPFSPSHTLILFSPPT